MKYFKNTELAKLYHVSEKSVRNWVEASSQSKLQLTLHEVGGHPYIANTPQNLVLIEQLVEKGKKYKNRRSSKKVSPPPYFYKHFTTGEIVDIVSNLDIYREIPVQYSYVDGGADNWDAYIQKLAKEKGPNLLHSAIELLDLTTPYLDTLLDDNEVVNIIDIGPGNCYPVRTFLNHFLKSGRLHRYIGVDISQHMLDIAQRNIADWFGERVRFEGYVRDITRERFNDLLVDDYFRSDEKVRNIVVFMGSTISNFRQPAQALQAIHDSMNKDDIFIFSKQLDTPNARRYFDFETDPDNTKQLSRMDQFTLKLLNIDESLYDAEQFFDEKTMSRRIQVRLRVDLTINFEMDGKTKSLFLHKGEAILLWRNIHQDTIGTIHQLHDGNFNIYQTVISPDSECILSISKIQPVN
jgi:uncharacterized SAM-dependent methyltransferase